MKSISNILYSSHRDKAPGPYLRVTLGIHHWVISLEVPHLGIYIWNLLVWPSLRVTRRLMVVWETTTTFTFVLIRKYHYRAITPWPDASLPSRSEGCADVNFLITTSLLILSLTAFVFPCIWALHALKSKHDRQGFLRKDASPPSWSSSAWLLCVAIFVYIPAFKYSLKQWGSKYSFVRN